MNKLATTPRPSLAVEQFIEELRAHIKEKKYFLFGSDSCKTITKLYCGLIDEFKEQKDDFILVSSKTKVQIKDACNQFKNKYVFYSPSITTGVSFVLRELKQDQFIYISQNPKVNPISIYQMASRTRNMNKLLYYSREIKPIANLYKDVSDVENKYKNLIKQNEKILSLSKSINENDEISIIENTFFKLFCYNEYQNSIFKTGFTEHFENILKSNGGFNLIQKGESRRLDIDESNDLNEIYQTLQDDEIKAYLNYRFDDVYDEEELKKNYEIIQNKYHSIDTKLNLLNIPNKEEADKYKIFLNDDYALRNYYNFLNLMKSSEYIMTKQKDKVMKNFKVKTISNVYNKLLLLEKFENHYKIERFNLDFKHIDISKEFNTDTKELIKNVFRITKDNYSNQYELKKIYVGLLKNICGDIPIITSKYKKINKKCLLEHTVNNDMIKDLIVLCKYNNAQLTDYNISVIEKLTGIKPEPKSTVIFSNDEDSMFNSYVFNKIYKL